ncbi:hypothetical protein GT360_03355 [Vibrio astriarenae]|uniref:Uncharacterized protein n=1 Tax=Vibrio astriarenae TaxID=1481923 RepID=A0A7Z2T1H9_9VIBR|nr:hypothetical protein [Vibrio astriarenae]QIA62609.1 hypothetical protein GT360_03355 [Vibrio astriarenae]
MTMVCAKEFAEWLKARYGSETKPITMSRKDVSHLTGRTRFTMGFVHDVHFEMMQYGFAFVTDMAREDFFLLPIGNAVNWRDQLELQYEKELYCNIFPIAKTAPGP